MASTSIAFDIIARDRASSKFDKVGDSASKTGGKLGKLGKIAAVGLVGGVAAAGAAAVVAGKALFDMAKGAIEDEQAAAKLARQLHNSAGATKGQVAATESWISAQGRALGVADDQLRPALGKLVAATHDVGKAQKLTSLAMDISAGSGKSLNTVTEALVKAQNGSVGGLSRLGVATKDAEGKTKSLKEITADLARTYDGQAARAANTTQGKFSRLKLIFDETKESIGARLIPVALKLADWAIKFTPKVEALATKVGAKLGPVLRDLGGFVRDDVLPVVQRFASFIANRVVPVLVGIWADALQGARGMIANLSKGIKDNRPFLDALGQALRKVGEFVLKHVLPAVGTFYKVALPALGTAIGKGITIVRKLTSGLLTMADFGVKSFRFLLNAALSVFGGILSAAEKGLGWIPKLGPKIRSAKKSFDEFKDGTIASLDKTAAALRRVNDQIKGIPRKKTVQISVAVSTQGKLPKGVTLAQYARGTAYHPGGLAVVGEEGPEIVDLPAGSRVHTAAESRRMATGSAGGATTVLEIRSGGSKVDDLLVELLRGAIRARGGNVQLVLGR